ncbi:MAG: peptidylprolyl isomerase [Prochlorococcus marinus CUG1434]|nr:peptidylprolyl isomerase [Prochlorococcus marinus CUG1434]
MIDLEKDIEDNLNDLSIEFVYLLRKNNLLFQFLKNYITNIICSKVDLTINIDELNEDFCRKNNIKDENNLITFLALKSMTLEDHKKNLENSEKIKSIALNEFSKNAETEFIKSKTLLDKYTYSLITVKESDLAHELYLQLDSEEAEFSSLAKKYSLEGNTNSMGLIGPQSLGNVHPVLKEKLLTAKKCELLNPFQIDKWWVVVRLEEKIEAKLDDFLRQEITLSLFDKWVNILTINSSKKLIDNTSI